MSYVLSIFVSSCVSHKSPFRLLLHCYHACQKIFDLDDVMCTKYEIRTDRNAVKTRQLSTLPSSETTSIPTIDDHKNGILLVGDSLERDDTDIPATEQNVISPTPSSDPIIDPMSDDELINELIPSLATNDSSLDDDDDNIIIWFGSTAAKTFQCRGWNRSDDEWQNQSQLVSRRRDINIIRCTEDPKYKEWYNNN